MMIYFKKKGDFLREKTRCLHLRASKLRFFVLFQLVYEGSREGESANSSQDSFLSDEVHPVNSRAK